MNARSKKAFALVITLLLLALLGLALFCLSALTKIGHESAASATHERRARQHALLGFRVALGELQRLAGDDSRCTGMAGVAGIAGGPAASTRYWTGVWQSDGAFLGWLVSGAASVTGVNGDPVELIGSATVGAAVSTSANVEKEHVIAGRVAVTAPTLDGEIRRSGDYAYLVVDEGIKISAYVPPTERAALGAIPAIGASMLSNQLKLKSAVEATPSQLPAILFYEQLGLLPGLTPSVLQDCFHYVSLTPRTVNGAELRAGRINVNTTSTLVWRSLLDTYNAMPGVIPVANVTTRGNQIGQGFAASAAGKASNGPFTSLDGLARYLETIFPSAGTPTAGQLLTALGPFLTTRSDTFRIRAYGDAVNPADPGVTESVAFCEAWVQRTPEILPGFGRRFVVTTFRWLGPDDL